MNIKHLYSHIGIRFFEGFGGLLYMGLIGINPIGFFFGLGILGLHSFLALGVLLYDKINLTDTLIENMEDYKKHLIVQFDGIEDKIEERINKIKIKAENQIKFFVQSQNTEFKGIKNNMKEYEALFNDIKKMYEIE